jgi:hypothetical protein
MLRDGFASTARGKRDELPGKDTRSMRLIVANQLQRYRLKKTNFVIRSAQFPGRTKQTFYLRPTVEIFRRPKPRPLVRIF